MKIKNTNILPNLGLMLYFTYMLDPFFLNSFVNINRLLYYAIALFPVFYSLIRSHKLRIDKSTKRIITCLLVIMCWSILMSGLVAGDLYYFSDMIKLLFKVVAAIGMFIVWRDRFEKRTVTWSYEKVFAYAIATYILFSILFWIVSELRNFWVNLIYNDRQPQYILEMASYATRYGLAGWSSFGEAYMVLFGEVAVIIMHHKGELSRLQFIILNMIMLIGTFLYGRFALVVVIVLLILWGIYTLLVQKKIWGLNVLLGSVLIGIFAVVTLYNNPSTRVIIEWAFEPIFNYIAVGHFSVNSTAELNEMYKSFNPSSIEIMFGVGKWYENSGLPYKLTDVGFMRNIYFGGIGYCILLYGTDLLLSYKCSFSIKCSKSFKRLMFVIFVVILISADLKGSMTFNFMKYTIPFFMANKYYLGRKNEN